MAHNDGARATIFGTIGLDEESKHVLTRFADSVDTLTTYLNTALSDTSVDITPDLSAFERAMSDSTPASVFPPADWQEHASYGHTQPETCACGQPIHAGSVWIPAGTPPEAASALFTAPTVVNDPVVEAKRPLDDAEEGDAWLIRFGADGPIVVALIVNDHRGERCFVLRDSFEYGEPKRTRIDEARIDSARLLFRQGEPLTSVGDRVASGVFTDRFIAEHEREIEQRIAAGVAEMRANYDQACQTIALMHAAATGREGEAPEHGVIEDVRAVRQQRDDAIAGREAMTVKHAEAADELVEQQRQNAVLHRQFGDMSKRREALDQIIYRARVTLREDEQAREADKAGELRANAVVPTRRETIERVSAILGDVVPHMIGQKGRSVYSRSTEQSIALLDGLRDRAVVLDDHGDVWQKRGDMWCSFETASVNTPLLVKYQPFIVLDEGRLS